ncbi:hypothetical protein cyc_03259 [Cyclospora cayetanensis]|uniref:Uncharacterized protein n=1 Tax=Cyclospora cayetanensis TaxID=88456 RepID=A0A1D3D7J6_9EIME|nr:hypothetical protein cyc_03259 [Cyclospora cayetanensis]
MTSASARSTRSPSPWAEETVSRATTSPLSSDVERAEAATTRQTDIHYPHALDDNHALDLALAAVDAVTQAASIGISIHKLVPVAPNRVASTPPTLTGAASTCTIASAAPPPTLQHQRRFSGLEASIVLGKSGFEVAVYSPRSVGSCAGIDDIVGIDAAACCGSLIQEDQQEDCFAEISTAAPRISAARSSKHNGLLAVQQDVQQQQRLQEHYRQLRLQQPHQQVTLHCNCWPFACVEACGYEEASRWRDMEPPGETRHAFFAQEGALRAADVCTC